jgi:hypothetical protein
MPSLICSACPPSCPNTFSPLVDNVRDDSLQRTLYLTRMPLMYANVHYTQTRDSTDCMHFCSGINNEIATVDHPCKEGSDGTAPVCGTTLTHALTYTHLPKLRACVRACVP